RKPGDRRVRVERPHSQLFRYSAPGVLVARPKAHEGRSRSQRLWVDAKAVLVGRPLASEEEASERLSKKKALAIFSSDAISSSAYATEEIVRVLVLGGVAALFFSVQIAVAVALLLALVAFSYRQVVYAYPMGGGSYSVSKANFGRTASLVAASALLIDYVLTVSVSTSSAVEQMASAVPALHGFNVWIGVGAIALITLANLRGIREAGNIFAVPTYLFVFSALLMIGIGVYRIVILNEGVAYGPEVAEQTTDTLQAVGVLLLIRAFAAGSVALTGTEAIATGVPAFQPPEPRNAARTLMVMAVLLAVLFIGITFLATNFGITHVEGPGGKTVLAQVAEVIYGAGTLPFYLFQLFTALILFLAANTSFNAFPRLAAILAVDSFMPRQFAFRGDRLAFSLGIVVLGVVAASLVVVFQGETHLLIPLYAVGVFIDFTISQAGMVKHWLAERPRGYLYRLAINATGCAVTATVAVVVTAAKAPTSLIVIVLIPCLVAMMRFIQHEYAETTRQLELRPDQIIAPPHRRERVIVPIPNISRPVVQAVNFGRSIADDVRAVHVTDDAEAAAGMREAWERQIPGVPLIIVESPYRSLVPPFLAYLDVVAPESDEVMTIVIVPEYVARHWWERILYNQLSDRIRRALIGRPHTVVTSLPYRRERR
ncbi:MAG TPA: APC family permease, partial [Candidatus Limnocylindrales bacterium]